MATASTFEFRSAFSRWQCGARRTEAGRKTMELRHQRYFVAVAKELIFTRAAKWLAIKQPPFGLHIRQLEREMGTPLFRRETRGVKLTESGAPTR